MEQNQSGASGRPWTSNNCFEGLKRWKCNNYNQEYSD
jgi:hypothetical protein